MTLIEVLSTNRKLLNFTYKMFNPADGSWGIVREDYSWSGLAGHVAYGYRGTDIAICDIYNTYSWNKIFRPTTDFDRDIIQGGPTVFYTETGFFFNAGLLCFLQGVDIAKKK